MIFSAIGKAVTIARAAICPEIIKVIKKIECHENEITNDLLHKITRELLIKR
jgi:hypothetical protein